MSAKKAILLVAVLFVLVSARPAVGCTIVMVSKEGVHLVGNNEDWRDSNTWMWFYPAADGEYGRVCFGFGQAFGYAQGGMNDQGLAIDGNGLEETGWQRDPNKEDFRGATIDYILAHCATVDDAVRFFEHYNVPSLARAKLPIADARGNSLVVEWGQGKLQLLRRTGSYQISTNFVQSNFRPEDYPCTRYKNAENMILTSPALSVDLIRAILSVTHSEFLYPTVYSNIYDLGNQTVRLYNLHNFEEVVTIQLSDELKKGRHAAPVPSLFKWKTVAAEIFEFLYPKHASDELLKLVEKDGVEAAIARFYEHKKRVRSMAILNISEEEIDKLGWYLAAKDRLDDAIAILRLNVSEDPRSWRARERLGQVYLKAGKKEQAVDAFREALALNPSNEDLRARLKEIQ